MVRINQAVIFDFDGVIVLTSNLKARAHSLTVKHFGGHANEDLYNMYLGFPHRLVRQKFMQDGHIKIEPEEYTAKYRMIYDSLLVEDLETAPGITKLLNKLKDNEYSLAIVSSNTNEVVRRILELTNLNRYFEFFVSSEDIDNDKPAPDGYLAAINKLNTPLANIVVFEDSSPGITAAKKAGLSVVAVRHSLNRKQDFSEAIYIIDSLVNTGDVLKIIKNIMSGKQQPK